MKLKKKLLIIAVTVSVLVAITTTISASSLFDKWQSSDEVIVDKEWTIQLSQDINKNTVTANSVYVKEASGANHQVETAVNRNKITVKPITPYKEGITYSLFITTDVKTLTGQPLKTAIQKDFTVGADESTAGGGAPSTPTTGDGFLSDPIVQSELNEINTQLNSLPGKLTTTGEKELATYVQSVVQNMIANQNYDYEAQEETVRAMYRALSAEEQQNFENRVWQTIRPSLLRKYSRIFGVDL